MSVYDFIEYTKKDPLKFINYCEVIINEYGGIIIAKPSHVIAMINYISDKYNISKEEIKNEIPFDCLPIEWLVDKYNFISVWYSGYMYSNYHKPNRAQKKTIKELMNHSLINNENPFIAKAYAYGDSLK